MSEERIYDLYSHAHKANPFPTFTRMRAEAPICQELGLQGEGKIWFVTRYADVQAVLLDHKRFVKNWRNTRTAAELAQLPAPSELDNLLSQHMLNLDGADHLRLRTLVNKAFGARIIQQVRGRVQQIADELLAALPTSGTVDLIDAYAFPLPIVVIAELLGIPAADRDRFRAWSNAFIAPSLTEAEWQEAEKLLREFVAYLSQVFAERRRQPREDLISALVQAEEEGDKLSEAELYAMVILLIVAGHETTVNLIGNGVLALLQNPDQLQRLRQQPELIESAVEEFLRYSGPVERATLRFAAEDVELGGQLIRRGEPILPVLLSANHDEAVFAAADQLDLARPNNRHVAFGHGVHYCVGAPLARLEGQIAIQTLLQRLPNLRLAAPVDSLTWTTVPILRGLKHLPVAWDA